MKRLFSTSRSLHLALKSSVNPSVSAEFTSRSPVRVRPKYNVRPKTESQASLPLGKLAQQVSLEALQFGSLRGRPEYSRTTVDVGNFDEGRVAPSSDLYESWTKRTPIQVPETEHDLLSVLSSIPKTRDLLSEAWNVKSVDEMLCNIIMRKTNLDLSLWLMDTMVFHLSFQATRLKFFRKFLTVCERNLRRLRREQLVQVVHYCGISKNRVLAERTLESALPMIRELVATGSVEDPLLAEMGILCAAYHKCGMKITDPDVLEKLTAMVQNVLKEGGQGHCQATAFPLISMLKVLRHSMHWNENLLHSVKSFISQHLVHLSMAEMHHLLSVLSNAFHFDEELCRSSERHASDLLASLTTDWTKTHPSQTIRPKDLEGILWNFCSVGYRPDDAFLTSAENFMRGSYQAMDYFGQMPCLIKTLFYLGMVNRYPEDLLNKVLRPEVASNLIVSKQSRTLQQLGMLEYAWATERGGLHSKQVVDGRRMADSLPHRSISQELEQRPMLKETLLLLKDASPPSVLVSPAFPIPHLLIGSICINSLQSDQGAFYIEVLDEHVCCSNISSPVGLMKWKMRLLVAKGFPVITVKPEDLECRDRIWETVTKKLSDVP
ncbi:unnamed protein product [Darwinula stevensoni]|uniref:RAP domain-containing protein n=1 Tax=Darwinula stevensoni TaxID=69355 RepID=A0A7R9AAD1_9CRUS|nr:unnamed protein product [Darwinula stevensoni]CAG0898325.1 unnamed protein product [Darwinula stevensoni]